ncbi:MAG: pre-peptidase C-terminal domain-containing protein, partial [Saprospiraceae bacterium]
MQSSLSISRFFVIIIGILLWIVGAAFTPIQAQLCSSGTTPISFGVPIVGNNSTGTNNVSSGWGGTATDYSGPEIVYEFTLSSSKTIKVNLTNLQANLDLFLDGNCDEGFNQGASMQSGTTDEEITINLSPGTYQIIVEGRAGATSSFTLTMEDVFCIAATPITCSATLSGTTVGGINNKSTYSCVNFSETGPEAFYSFTVSSVTNVTIDLTNITGGDIDLFLMGGDCMSNCLTRSTNSGLSDEQILYNVNIPGIYYIVIDGYIGAASSFDLSLTCTSLCDNPTTITCGQTINGDTNTGTNSIDNYCGTTSDHSGKELVYAITMQAGEFLNVTLSGLTQNLDLFLLSNICDFNNCLAFSTSSNNTDENINFSVTVSGIYYIVIDGVAGVTSPFTLTSTCPNLCDSTFPIVCDVPQSGNTSAGTDFFDGGYCGSLKDYSGHEIVYEVAVPVAGILQIDLTTAGTDLDLFLLDANCGLSNCLASSATDGVLINEQIEAEVSIGTYYIVVESQAGLGQGDFNISVNCLPGFSATVNDNDAYIDLNWNLSKSGCLGAGNYPLGVVLEILDGSSVMVPGCEIPGVIYCEVFGNVTQLNELISGTYRHLTGPNLTKNYTLRIRERDNGTTLCTRNVQGQTMPFQPPTLVTASDATDPDSVIITWLNHSKLADRFKIYRDGTNFSGDLGIEGTDVGMTAFFNDVYVKDGANSLVNGTAYNYCVEVYSTIHNQAYAHVCDMGSTFDIGFSATDDNPVTSVDMVWNDISAYCDKITIQRDGITIVSLPNTATSYMDQSPIYGKTSTYSIKLFNGLTESIEVEDPGSVPRNGAMSGRVVTQEGFYPVNNVKIELFKDSTVAGFTELITVFDTTYRDTIIEGVKIQIAEVDTLSEETTTAGFTQEVLVMEVLTDFNGTFSFPNLFYDLETEFSLKASKTGKSFDEATLMVTLNSAMPTNTNITFLENSGFTTSSASLNLNVFTVSPDITTDKTTLDWNYMQSVGQVTFFNIYRGSNLIAALNDNGGAINQLIDLDGIPNIEYIYTLEAFRIEENTNQVITVTLIQTETFPAVTTVKSLDVQPDVNLGKVSLNWSTPAYSSANIIGFRIFRNGSQIAQLPLGINTFEDFYGEPGTQTSYQILAYRTVHNLNNEPVDYESDLFPEIPVPVTFPALTPPQNVIATPKPNEDLMEISWDVPAVLIGNYNYKGFNIYRKEDGAADFILIANKLKNFAPAGQTVIIKDLTGKPDTSYTYRVSAILETPDTSYEQAATSASTAYPSVKMPPNLTANPDFGQVEINWTPHTSTNHNGFEVFRDGSSVGTVPTGGVHFIDYVTNPPHNSINYEVKSFRIVEGQTYYSAPSTITSAPLDASATPLFMPFNVTASNDLANMVKVCWNYDPNINAEFIIKREGVIIATLVKGTRAYFDYNASCGPDLQYEVIASKNALLSFPAKAIGALKSIRIISGKVTRNLSGQGVAGVLMTAKDDEIDQEIYFAQTITDATGYYEFVGLPCIDNLGITITADGDNSDFTNGGNVDITTSQSVNITINQLGYPLDFIDYFETAIEPGIAIPLAVTATRDPANCRMIINWSPSNGNYTGFEIFRGPGMIGEVLNGQSLVFYDTEGVPGVEYFYGVRSYLLAGEERTESETVSANNIFPELFPVNNLTATFNPDANQTILNWSHVYNNHDSYRIQRNDIVVATILTSQQLTWTDENIAPGKAYKYSVTAIKGLFASETISINFTAAGVSEVKNLAASIPTKVPCVGETSSKNHVRLDWAYQDGGADGFEIYRDGILIAELTEDIMTMGDNPALTGHSFSNGNGLFFYTDYLGIPGGNHQYEIVAFVLREDIKISSGVAAAIPSVSIAFPALSEVCGLTAIAQAAEGNIILCLGYDSLSQVKGFYIYRDGIRVDTVFFIENPNGEVDTIIVKWIDDKGVPNANYNYSAKAFSVRNGMQYEGTNVCTAIVAYPAITVPQNFNASDGTYPDFIKLIWAYNENADIDRFEYQFNDGFGWSNPVNIGSGKRSFLHTAKGGFFLQFRVRAVKIVGGTEHFSSWSNFNNGFTSGSSDIVPETDTGDFSSDELGNSVTIDKGLAAAGAPGSTGNEFYAYQINGSDLTFEGKTSRFGTSFGESIAMSGEHLIVGDPNKNSNEGKVFFYKWDGKDWVFVDSELPVNILFGTAFARLGMVVAIDGDRAVVGAPRQLSAISGG